MGKEGGREGGSGKREGERERGGGRDRQALASCLTGRQASLAASAQPRGPRVMLPSALPGGEEPLIQWPCPPEPCGA